MCFLFVDGEVDVERGGGDVGLAEVPDGFLDEVVLCETYRDKQGDSRRRVAKMCTKGG